MQTVKQYAKRLWASVWLFPVACLLLLVLLTSLQISGSSVSSYYKDMYGPNAKDPNLIIGNPRAIRSDEWEWQSSMLMAQSNAGYPEINRNIGDGQDMEVIVDVPYKTWSVIFKPQNLGFFILPFSFAFALKWWLMAVLLVVSAYFFILILLPRKRLLAAILASSFFLSPFIQWWYQTITVAPLAYSFLIAIAFIKLCESRGRQKFAWSALLVYALSSFAIVLYPPFQIPCLLALAAFLVGYGIEKQYYSKKMLRQNFKYLLVCVMIFIAIVSTFVITNKTAIQATQDSIYPGKRLALSGNFDSQIFFGNFLDSQLQFSRRAKNYVANQSEASNFLLLSPFLTVPALYYVIQTKRKTKKIDWPLLATTTLFLVLLVRLFVSGTDFLFKLMLLETVPHARLLIGIGLLSFFQLILIIRHLHKNKVSHYQLVAVLAAASALACNLVVGLATRHDYPGYVHNLAVVIGLAAIPALVIYLLLSKRFVVGAALLFLFSAVSAGIVHPLYRSTGPLYKSAVTSAIKTTAQEDPSAKWAMVGNLIYENLPAISGVPSLTGIYAYPQNSFWDDNPNVAKQSDVYNRYAHTLVDATNDETKLRLRQPDLFEITGSPCSQFFKDSDVRFFIAEEDLSQEFTCLKLRNQVSYPNKSFYILEVN